MDEGRYEVICRRLGFLGNGQQNNRDILERDKKRERGRRKGRESERRDEREGKIDHLVIWLFRW